MNRLANHGINLDVCESELERSITRSLSAGSISSIRNDLFSEARESGLTTAGDALVARRKTNGGKTVKGKHASDICQLVGAIKSKTALPRTLLRNGKRSRDEFTASQARHQVIPRPTVLHQSCDTLNASHLSEPDTPMINVPDDSATTAFRSTVVSDISSLKSSVGSLREDIQLLKGRLNKEPSAVDDCDTCLLYVRLKNSTKETLNEVLLESKLNTKIQDCTYHSL